MKMGARGPQITGRRLDEASLNRLRRQVRCLGEDGVARLLHISKPLLGKAADGMPVRPDAAARIEERLQGLEQSKGAA